MRGAVPVKAFIQLPATCEGLCPRSLGGCRVRACRNAGSCAPDSLGLLGLHARLKGQNPQRSSTMPSAVTRRDQPSTRPWVFAFSQMMSS